MALLLMTTLSLLLTPCASAGPSRKDCDDDKEACVSLLQTGLDVDPPGIIQQQDSRFLDRRRAPKETWKETSPKKTWVMPTGKPTVHTGTIVGRATDVVNGDPLRCLEASCPYGVFLTEELRRVGRKMGYETQVALYNFWGLDQTLPKGDVAAGDVQSNHPEGDNTSFYKLKGDILVDILEDMLSQHGPLGEGGSTGSWLQVAGLRFQATWAPVESANGSEENYVHMVIRKALGSDDEVEMPATRGKWTLQNVHVDLENGRWVPIDPNYVYNVVSNHQVRFGVKRERINANAVSVDDKGSSIADIIIDVFKARSPVTPPHLDDRELLAVMGEKVGVNEMSFDVLGCLDHACAYGMIACEEFRRVGRELGFSTQIALYSGALIRAPLKMGEVYVKDVFKVHPDGSLLGFFWLQGVAIRQMLQSMMQDHGAPGTGNHSSWLQMAGLRFQATWDKSNRSWTLGPVQVELDKNLWRDVDNDLDYAVVADAFMLVEGGSNDTAAKYVPPNAVLQGRPLESGPAVVAVMAGVLRYQSPITAPMEDDRQCLTGNCSWLDSGKLVVDKALKVVEEPTSAEVEGDEPWWWWRFLAALKAMDDVDEKSGEKSSAVSGQSEGCLRLAVAVCLSLCAMIGE